MNPAGLLLKRSAFLNREPAVAAGLPVLYRRGTDVVQINTRPDNTPTAVGEAI